MNDDELCDAYSLQLDLEDLVWFLNHTATMIETGIPGALDPGEDLHPHMWERLNRLPYAIMSIMRACRDLAWDLEHYLERIGVEPAEWQADILQDLENLHKEQKQ